MTTHDFSRLVDDLEVRWETRKLIACATPEQIMRRLEDIRTTPEVRCERG